MSLINVIFSATKKGNKKKQLSKKIQGERTILNNKRKIVDINKKSSHMAVGAGGMLGNPLNNVSVASSLVIPTQHQRAALQQLQQNQQHHSSISSHHQHHPTTQDLNTTAASTLQ